MESVDKAAELRQTVANTILTNPKKYNKGFLGGTMEPEYYAEWICLPDQWGGIPELKILSEFYKIRATVIDVGAEDMRSYGPLGGDEIFLIYDGSHYNIGARGTNRKFP